MTTIQLLATSTTCLAIAVFLLALLHVRTLRRIRRIEQRPWPMVVTPEPASIIPNRHGTARPENVASIDLGLGRPIRRADRPDPLTPFSG